MEAWNPGRRGRGGYFHKKFPQNRSTEASRALEPSFPPPPLGSLVQTIRHGEATSTDRKDAVISGVEVVASFNWMQRDSPTVIMPGKPPLWTPLAKPRPLPQDSGTYYRDRNAANDPDHPMEATIRAIMQQNQLGPSQKVDVVCCASTFGNLLRFVQKEDRDFRMLVEIIGTTVHLIRRENNPLETLTDVWGYGHTFPEANTTWEADVRGSKGHQRILSYRFGGLNFLLRFEADGYLGERGSLSGSSTSAAISAKGANDLISAMTGIGVSSSAPTSGARLEVESTKSGILVPQTQIFDLKTRSIKKISEDCLGQQIQRLWVAQVPNFVLGYHERGVFNKIEVKNVAKEVREWEENNQATLTGFAGFLNSLVSLVRETAETRLELVRNKPDQIELRQQTSDLRPMLRAETAGQWTHWLGKGPSKAAELEVSDSALDWSDDEKDYTACSQACQYCGRCSH